ncbi:MAG: hypothetical protein HQK72_16685 [Desulfamplus sp.]|nr:hypothetical protein [Desulfamplus sp.]
MRKIFCQNAKCILIIMIIISQCLYHGTAISEQRDVLVSLKSVDSESCITIYDNLNINMCVVYNGVRYGFILKYIPQSSEALWKMDKATFRQIDTDNIYCISIDKSLSLEIPCLIYGSDRYKVKMNYYSNPNDINELYWKLADITLLTSNETSYDFTITLGDKNKKTIKPLNGINAGPIHVGEDDNVDLIDQYKELGIKYVRTHDFYGPFDMSQIYKDRTKDPLNSGSYNFEDTDKYYEGIISADATTYFRLGDSYNNSVPPETSERSNWVEASMNVIAHYYEGKWSGYNGNFEYVEIWNEPDNSQFWPNKTLIDFFVLFDATAKKIRERFPKIKIGGPGFTQNVNLNSDKKQILRDFLSYIKSKNTPIDFISFHQYVNEPSEITTAVNSMKDILKEKGFEGLPMHLTEWNTDAERQEQSAGEKVDLRIKSKGAAINTGTWIEMQNSGIDMAFFFRGDDTNIDNPTFYGLYKADGEPKKSAFAFKFFNDMSKYEDRLSASTTIPEGSSGGISSSELSSQIYVIAGEKSEDGTEAVLISNLSDKPYKYNLKKVGAGDTSENIESSDIISAYGISDEQSDIYNIGSGNYFELPAYGVQMISIKK